MTFSWMLLIIAVLSILGCGGDATTSEDAVSATEEGIEITPGTGQLSIPLEDGIQADSVEVFRVGDTNALDSFVANNTLTVGNIEPGSGDFIFTGALEIDSTALVDAPYRGRRINDVEVVADESKSLDKLDLPLGGSVSGKVLLKQPESVSDHAGIKVYIPGTSFDATSADDGSFNMDDLPVGVHNLYFEKDGYYRGVIEGVEVKSDETTEVSEIGLLLQTGSLGALILEAGKASTSSLTVNITLVPTEDAVVYKISENSLFSDAAFLPLKTSTTYTFDSEGAKTLYVQYANANGQPSSTFSASIQITKASLSVTSPSNGHKEFDSAFRLQGDCGAKLEIAVTYGSDTSGPATAGCAEGTFDFQVDVSGSAGSRKVTLEQTDDGGDKVTYEFNFEKIATGCGDPDYNGSPFANSSIEGADGSSANPYLICNEDQFRAFTNNDPLNFSKHFVLGQDITISSPGTINEVGDGAINHFDGSFDGNDFTITGLNKPMFGMISHPGSVENLKLNSTLNLSSGSTNVGLLTRLLGNSASFKGGTIDNCHASGTITSDSTIVGGLVGSMIGESGKVAVVRNSTSSVVVQGVSTVGGLVGQMSDYATVSESGASGNVSADEDLVGGLVGVADSSTAVLSEVYAKGDVVTSTASGGMSPAGTAGGLAGRLNGATITDCYALGDVTGNTSVGGLVGSMGATAVSITDCFSTGNVTGNSVTGGSIGTWSATHSATRVFWDQETEMNLGANDDVGTGDDGTVDNDDTEFVSHTTADLKTLATYVGFGFTAVWELKNPGVDYPVLRWEDE